MENSVARLTTSKVERRRLLVFKRKVLLRSIHSAFGRLWANVTVDRANEVEFRSPVAVASVRGTIVEINYDPATGVWFIGVAQGQAAITAQGITVVARGGQAVTVARGQPPSAVFGWSPGPPPAISEAAVREALAAPPPPVEAAPALAPPAPTLAAVGAPAPTTSVGGGGEVPPPPEPVRVAVPTMPPVVSPFPQGSIISETRLSNQTLGDDGFVRVNFAGGYSFPFYGTRYNSVFVNANGNLTFGSGDSAYNPVVEYIQSSYPRVAPFFTDLDFRSSTLRPVAGSLTVTQRTLSWTATYFGVGSLSVFEPGWASASSSFRITLFSTGAIQLDFNGFTGPVQGQYRDIVVTAVTPGGGLNQILNGVFSAGGISSNSQQTIVQEFPVPIVGEGGSFDLTNRTLLFTPNAAGGFNVTVCPLGETCIASPSI